MFVLTVINIYSGLPKRRSWGCWCTQVVCAPWMLAVDIFCVYMIFLVYSLSNMRSWQKRFLVQRWLKLDFRSLYLRHQWELLQSVSRPPPYRELLESNLTYPHKMSNVYLLLLFCIVIDLGQCNVPASDKVSITNGNLRLKRWAWDCGEACWVGEGSRNWHCDGIKIFNINKKF